MSARYVAPDDANSGANVRSDDRDSLRARLADEDRADHLAAGAPLHDAEVDREHEGRA
jgi:hypothetical protein